jgi:glycosyltransferase involved in cell wall biosynthesis
MNEAKTSLVIVTTHFGSNFSGGSTATCEIFSRLQHEFETIYVVGTELGEYPFQKIIFKKYRNWVHAIFLLLAFRKGRFGNERFVFYGDFYNSFLLALLGLNFYFTYHDNWPEAANINLRAKVNSVFYINVYHFIFKRAKIIFTVSEKKYHYIKKFTNKTQLIYNGFNHQKENSLNKEDSLKYEVLMVGNIDKRKYKIALKLFSLFNAKGNLKIDIYGHIINQKLADKLAAFEFVALKGFKKNIPFGKYQLLLHTSITENLPLVFCESIYHRTPILSFDVGGAYELIGSANGSLIAPYDVNAMHEQLLKMAKTTPTIDKSVLGNRSWEIAAKRYKKFIL